MPPGCWARVWVKFGEGESLILEAGTARSRTDAKRGTWGPGRAATASIWINYTMAEEAGQQARRRLRFFFLIYFFLYLFHKFDSISPRSLAILCSTSDAFLCANSTVHCEKQACSARPSQCTAAYHTQGVKHAASLKTLEKARESKGDSKSWFK